MAITQLVRRVSKRIGRSVATPFKKTTRGQVRAAGYGFAGGLLASGPLDKLYKKLNKKKEKTKSK